MNRHVQAYRQVKAQGWSRVDMVLALYDPEARLGGMLHAMLSTSSNAPPEIPAKFVDTGAEFLLRELYAKGAVRARLRAVVAGGAEPGGLLQTGTKNLSALKKVLWKHGISSTAMDVGGRGVRVVTLDCAVGRCVATSRDSRVVLLP